MRSPAPFTLTSIFCALVLVPALAAQDVCQTYRVQAGDTLESISKDLSIEQGALIASIVACGGTADLQAGTTVCLPGGESEACQFITTLPETGREKCKYYILQAGDTLASVAVALNIYQPDLEAVNPAWISGTAKPDDLVRMPNWDDAVCGILPNTLAELREQQARSSPPPAALAPNGEQIKAPPSPAASPPAIPTAPPPTAENNAVTECRGYRAGENDTPYTIAALFSTPIGDLVAVNPDLASGAPISPGAVLKIPPYSADCAAPVLVDPAALLVAAPLMAPGQGMKVPDASSLDDPPAVKAPQTNTVAPVVEEQISTPVVETTPYTIVPVDNLGRRDSIAEGRTEVANIVSDTATQAPTQRSGSNSGNIVMGVSIFFAVLVIVGLLGLACGGTTSHTNTASSQEDVGNKKVGLTEKPPKSYKGEDLV